MANYFLMTFAWLLDCIATGVFANYGVLPDLCSNTSSQSLQIHPEVVHVVLKHTGDSRLTMNLVRINADSGLDQDVLTSMGKVHVHAAGCHCACLLYSDCTCCGRMTSHANA